jgi:metallo-beta-lactamase family protein
MKISFLGAARTVTGSRFLLELERRKILIDCGLFQGLPQWKQYNWTEFPIEPSSISCMILTHAHIDHSGFIPRFVQMGFRGEIYCTPATAELLDLLLPDSGHLQEEDAAYANLKKYSRHDPALPLYTEDQARESLQFLRPVDFYKEIGFGPDFSFTLLRAGHILGSAMVQIHSADRSIVFTGDVGRPAQFITKSPDNLKNPNYLILESTYGNRLHQRIDVKQALTEIILKTTERGGVVLVPAFAVGRTQELLFILRILEETKKIPGLPVFIDSPMAIHALPIYSRHQIDFTKELSALAEKDDTPFICDHIQVMKTVQDSMKLNDIHYPAIIISSSGMATGGRILHHLKHKIGDPRNTVLFIGFQAEGTKGRMLVDGAQEIRIHKQIYPVRARIEYMDALSCHADYEEILQWLTSIEERPVRTFLVHGEEAAGESLATKITERFGWDVHRPEYRESVEL